MAFTCGRCGSSFQKNQGLQRHMARKRPCDPVLAADALRDEPHSCRHCGRVYSRADSLTRHVKTCKIASGKRADHPNQLEAQAQLIATQGREMLEVKRRVAELASLLDSKLALAAGPALVQHVNIGAIQNNIAPWDGERRIDVDVGHIAAAFSQNARLKEYAQLGGHELVDPNTAPPYVVELLMDLVRRAHTNPAARNVYLNPRRHDQVLVHLKSSLWEVLPFADATRLLLDGVAEAIHRAVLSHEERRKLPLEAQNALSVAGLLYEDSPDGYAQRAAAPMTAHLQNTAPPAALTLAPAEILPTPTGN